jgi:citrate lyase synthetase
MRDVKRFSMCPRKKRAHQVHGLSSNKICEQTAIMAPQYILIFICRKQSGSALAKAVSLAVRASQTSIEQKESTAYGAPMRKILSKNPSLRTSSEITSVVRFLGNFEKFQSFSQVVLLRSNILSELQKFIPIVTYSFLDGIITKCCKNRV